MADPKLRRATDAPGPWDNIERLSRIIILGVFVLGMAYAMTQALFQDKTVPGEMVALVSVAIGFLGAEREAKK